jgi:hypothetical protein
MKGLAIASFLPGIIGFLLSFEFGSGLLPSILSVSFGIFPLVKIRRVRPGICRFNPRHIRGFIF